MCGDTVRYATVTMLDLILLDRLEKLEDQNAYHRIRLKPEVPISVTINTTDNAREEFNGRMDWALNYETGRHVKPGAILIIWEAKRVGYALTGLPQLLVYMTGVLESRRDRTNQSVFGVLSGAGTFLFAFLDDKRKFYTSKPYTWVDDQSTILSYIDAILLDAIESLPPTAPTKAGNTTLLNYQRYLKDRWTFGVQPSRYSGW